MREMTGTAAEHDPGAQSGHPMPTRRGLLVAGLPLVTLLGACGQENNSSCVTPSEVVPETTDEQEQRGMDTSASEGDPQVLSAEPQLSEHGLALSPDGTDPATDERWDLPRVPGSMGRLCWSPDGDVLYGVSRRGGVMAWDGGEDWRSFTLP